MCPKAKFSLALTFLLSFTFSVSSFAQKSDVGNWFIYFGSQKLSKKVNLWNEVQYRNYNFAGDMQQLLLRAGIGYDLTENNNNILLGYGFIRSENYLPLSEEKRGNNEHRIYQQFITKQNFGRLYIQHRYRAEERFLQDDFRMRFRYFLGLNIPITKKTITDKTLYASVYNEVFHNTGNTIFDRDRLYGALGYVINKSFKVEAGFMSQMTEKTHRNQFQVVFYNSLPFWREE